MTGIVNGLGKDVFAGPRFTEKKNRGIRRGDCVQEIEDS